jgi:hypothetical protein
MAGTPTLDELADELYALPPDQFVAARDERARAARATGDRSLASQLAGLRRPTTSAWVLNLLVRDQPELVDELLELGGELRRAQRELRGPELRELAGQRQRVVAALVRAARQQAALVGSPVSTETGYEVEQTLHAALADPDVAQQVRTGRLVKPIQVTGFEGEPTGPAAGDAAAPAGSAGAGGAAGTAGSAGAAGSADAGGAAGAGGSGGSGGGATRAAERDGGTAGDGTGPAGDGTSPAGSGGGPTGRGDPAGAVAAGAGAAAGGAGGAGARQSGGPAAAAGGSRQDAAQRRRQERAQAEQDRAAQEAARRQADRSRLQAARDAAQADLEAAEVELQDAAGRLAAAERARTDAADLVARLEEELNTARRSQRDSGGRLRDAQRRQERASRGRDGAARRLAEAAARLDAHRG